MTTQEEAFTFICQNEHLLGIVHHADAQSAIGVLIIVGGPQYRVGSHRQFTLLARSLAKSGIPVMRFDYRGMGDSSGDPHSFETINDDIRSAVDEFLRKVPTIRSVVLWGLCDAASAACFYAPNDNRVTGLVLLNPWVRTESGEAKAYLKHYYVNRVFDKTFWYKVIKGEVSLKNSVSSLFRKIRMVMRKDGNTSNVSSLPDRMLSGLQGFNGQCLFILSENDLTAQEFKGMVKASNEWKMLLNNDCVSMKEIRGADHTFSSQIWSKNFEKMCVEWIVSITGRNDD